MVIIWGMGSLSGAFIGALLLGFGSSIGFAFFPDLRSVFPFLLLIAVLMVRPDGIFGVEAA